MKFNGPRLSRLFALALACALAPLAHVRVSAQTDAGRVAGVVRDPNGAVVAGAAVVAKNERTGEERTATTDAEGLYQIPALRASSYTVTVTTRNFAANTFTHVQINVGQEQKLDVALAAAGPTEDVTVTAGATEAAIDTGSARMGATVNEREVVGLPLNGRQLSQLYLQAPGSVNSGSGTSGDIRFSGRAVEQNVVRYDGVEGSAVIDASPGNLNGEVASPFRLQSSLENVQEFRVDSNNFPAEFGTGTGGQISVVTKSGGNRFHGSGFEYLRNDALDAANFFDNIVGQKSPLKLNQFGGSLGGPFKKERLFFFGSYEGYRLRAGINSVEAVPGDAARVCAVVTCNSTQVAYLPAFRSPQAAVISRGTGANLFDVAQLQANSTVDEDAYSARLDWKVNGANSAYFRFFRDEGSNASNRSFPTASSRPWATSAAAGATSSCAASPTKSCARTRPS